MKMLKGNARSILSVLVFGTLVAVHDGAFPKEPLLHAAVADKMVGIALGDVSMYRDWNPRSHESVFVFQSATKVTSDGLVEVERRTMDGITLSTLTLNKFGVQVAENGYVNGIEKIPLTLAIGTTAEGRWTVQESGDTGFWRSVVKGSETITVPAGSFETWKIEYEEWGPGGQQTNQTIWVAPKVKQVVKIGSVTWPGGKIFRQELVAYRVTMPSGDLLQVGTEFLSKDQLTTMRGPIR